MCRYVAKKVTWCAWSASNLYDMNRFCVLATRTSAINEMRFFSPVGFRMCSRPAVTAALLGRRLPALNLTSGSSPFDCPDKLCDSPVRHLRSLRYASCRAFWVRCWWRIWHLPKTWPRLQQGWSWPLLLHPRCIIEGDRVGCGASQPFPLYRCAPPPLRPNATCVLCEMEILLH